MSVAPPRDQSVTTAVTIARAQSRRRTFLPRRTFLGLVGVLTLLLLWEITARTGLVDARFLPPPTEVLPRLAQIATFADFWVAIANTLVPWGIGLAISLVSATALGVVIGLSPFLRRATMSTVEFLRPIPSVALIPLASLLFGAGQEAAILLIVFACFWQIFIQVLYGVADVDHVAMSTGRSYGFTPWQRIRDVVLPTMLPYLMTGIRLAAAVALILAVIAQLIIGTPGLGKAIVLAQNGRDYTTMYALVLATGLLGVLINFGARLLEKRLLSWHHSVREDVVA